MAQQRATKNKTRPVNTASAKPAAADTASTKKSSSGLNSEVKYSAEDSIRIDKEKNIVFLYGKARISYEELSLDADYIQLDQKNKTVFAKGLTDPKTTHYHGRPIFKQGSEPPVTTDSMAFNMNTKKGKTYGTFSEVEGGYIHAAQSKKNPYNEVSIRNSIYTTCNLPHPHFGVHITKGIVTGKNIITGPAYLEIEDIPFPVGIPFGFFPKANKRASGIMLPTFGEEASRGFYLRNVGWYFGINDYWDATLMGSVYSKGSYESSVLARYRKNYKYDGSLNFRFASTRTGVEGTAGYKPTKDFNLQWSHSQRQEANPGTNFSASVNVGTGAFYQNTGASGTYNYEQVTRNSMSSSISYGKTFADGKVNFTTSLSHRQDISAKTVYLNLPNVNLSVSSFNPFDRKDRVGEQKWYQKITVGYNFLGDNTIDTKESELFKRNSLKDFQTSIQHSIPISLSLNALKYFQVSLSVPYQEQWYFKTYEVTKDSKTNDLVYDTIPGFARSYRYSYSTSLSTKLYGRVNFKKGKLLALRHVLTPTVGIGYTPGFTGSSFNFTRELKDENGNIVLDAYGREMRYSRFDKSTYDSHNIGKAASLSFGLGNTLDAKRRSKSDTTDKAENIPIIQSLSLNGNYNFLAPLFKLSPISINGNTALFKQKINLNFGGTINPYLTDAQGRDINQYAITKGRIGRLTAFNLSTDFNLNSTALNKKSENIEQQQNKTNITRQQQDQLDMISRNPEAFVDFNVPWNIALGYNFNYSKSSNGIREVGNVANTLSVRGDLSVTPKWKVQYNTSFDIRRNEFSFTNFSIYRDLHCWDMNFNWVPFGPYKSYSFDIRVRASILQDLKLSKRRDQPLNY